MDKFLRLNGRAGLVELEPGRVFVEYGTRHFAHHELVPYRILTGQIPSQPDDATMTAADLVMACMTERFGEARNWPQLARDFVYPHASRLDIKPDHPIDRTS